MKQTFLCINHRINKGVDLNVDSAFLLFLFVSEDVVGVSAGHDVSFLLIVVPIIIIIAIGMRLN